MTCIECQQVQCVSCLIYNDISVTQKCHKILTEIPTLFCFLDTIYLIRILCSASEIKFIISL